MISNNIHILTTDSHPIYEISTKKRINIGKTVVIGNHVWIAAMAHVYGAVIGDGAIIGGRSLVTGYILCNSLVAGIPAKVIKEGIE